jgi:hypothetical protein
MRIYAAVGAALGWFALALQLYLMLLKVPAGQMLGTVITFFSFFTILTNILVALVFTAAGFRPEWGHWFARPSVQAGSAVYIAIVGCSYQLLLHHLWNPQGAQWLADTLLHSVIRWSTSCIGCCSRRAPDYAGKTHYPGWDIPHCTFGTCWREGR